MPLIRCTFALLLLSIALFGAGCHRGYYRRQADAEVYALVRQKANDPRWDLPDPTIHVKPESRMHDPFSADHPPLPPDDPTSAKFMQLVDDKPGYSRWHANGDTDYVESPDWMAYLPVDERGNVIIDSTRAVNLALTHSTTYQRQREELYLSALDVSLERFGFDTQMFAGFNAFWTHSGRFRGGSPGSSSTTAEFSTGRTELTRLGATGSELVIGLANSVLWQFAGPNTQSASTLINFSFVQPLLRGAGRDVILESLTQAERTLLANVRQMERFRQGFFLLITTGRNAGTGPQRGGNFLNPPSQGSGSAGGVLGLLRTQQTIRIQEFNVSSLRNVLDQFIEFHKAERHESLQLSQTEGTLYQSESRLLSLRVDYETQLDQFKRELGLPPDLPIEIRDPFLRQFELIDNENNQRQYRIAELKVDVGNVLLDASAHIESNRFLIEPPPAAAVDPANPEAAPAIQPQDLNEEYGIRWSEELKQKIAAITPLLGKISPSIQEISVSDMGRIRADIEYLRQVRPRRVRALTTLRELVKSEGAMQYDIETGILEDASLEDPDLLLTELEDLVAKLAQTQSSIEQLQATVEDTIARGESLPPTDLYIRLDEGLLSEIPKQLTDLASISLEISLIQARARTDSIELANIHLSATEALQIARCCRLDWMNARASLVDSWRGIEVVADELESQFDLVFEGDLGNVGDNPFRIRYEAGQFRGGFRFDSPITRLAERNQYRQQLIQYQRDRRDYYEFEDQVNQGLRETLRNIELNKILFELNRRSIKVSVQQVEQSRLRLEEPPQGIGGAAGGSQLGSTTARDLTDALNRLQNDQNSFLGVWVTYEALRRDLNFDLGTMQLTDDGFWIDPGTIDASIGVACGAVQQNPENFPDIPNLQNAVPIEIQLEPTPNLAPAAPEQPSSSIRTRFSQPRISAAPVGNAAGSVQRPEPMIAQASMPAAAEAPTADPARNTEATAETNLADTPFAASLSSSDDLFLRPSRLIPTEEPHETIATAPVSTMSPSSSGLFSINQNVGPSYRSVLNSHFLLDAKRLSQQKSIVVPASLNAESEMTAPEVFPTSSRFSSSSESSATWQTQGTDRR